MKAEIINGRIKFNSKNAALVFEFIAENFAYCEIIVRKIIDSTEMDFLLEIINAERTALEEMAEYINNN